MQKSCCYNCKNRAIGCHAYCADYGEFRRILDIAKTKQRAEQEMVSFECDVKRKVKTLHERKRGLK